MAEHENGTDAVARKLVLEGDYKTELTIKEVCPPDRTTITIRKHDAAIIDGMAAQSGLDREKIIDVILNFNLTILPKIAIASADCRRTDGH